MANAGTALMGIGRASGEDRAVAAAQQAIESPLLEVSIDGARGILFNVIGGNDLAMHEINTAAETITSASDPEANIIFGATINDDLEGEIIITVVATGFDASYFSGSKSNKRKNQELPLTDKVLTGKDDVDDHMSDIDMNLDEQKIDNDFGSGDSAMSNIWSIDEEESENNSEKENSKDDDSEGMDNSSDDQRIVTSSLEEDLEKPSFLRRLKRRKDSDS